jgi:predicted dehydrogenase
MGSAKLTMTTHDIDLVTQWLAARDNEKTSAKVYHGDRPCLPTAALLEVCRRIFSKPTTNP